MGQRSPCPFEPGLETGSQHTEDLWPGERIHQAVGPRVARPAHAHGTWPARAFFPCSRERSRRSPPRRVRQRLLGLVHPGERVQGAAGAADIPGYVIQPGDVLQIRVFNQPEMSTRARVRDDGKVSIPFLNDVVAAGFTPNALAQQRQTRLKEYIDAPVVTISLEEARPFSVSVLGESTSRGSARFRSGPASSRRSRRPAASTSTHPATESSWFEVCQSERG